MLLNDIETMIEQDPNRATWLLRSAFLREHRRIERNAQRRGQQDRPAGDGPDSNNNPDYLDDSIIQTGRKVKCEVKVKRYTGYERKDTVETDRITTLEGSQSSADELEDQAQGDEGCSSCSTDDHVNNNDGDNKSLATFSLISAQQLFSSAVSMLGEGATKDDDNGEDGVQCAICLFDINVGDRIADLECKHMFCIECLKDWLKRKNHCPLCQLGGIAKPIVEDSAGENIRDVEAQQETAQEGRGPSSSAGDNTAESRPGSGRGGLIASYPLINQRHDTGGRLQTNSDSKSGKDGRHGNSDSRSGKDEDDAPTEPCKCPQYSKQFDGEEAVNPYVPKPEKCLLKRGKKQLMYEPDFPKSRPDVYIEVQISSGESFKFYPDDYPNSHDKNGGVIPLNDNTVFQKLYDEQEKFGGQGFKLRYVSKNGPGVWGSCKYTPIAFDLDGDGKVGHITSRAGFEIDITGDGDVEHLSEWFSPKEGILIDAHNKEGLKDFKNGVITGDHLMGDMGGEYTDGFAKLATYDDNCDDKLTGEELDGLYIWQDKNSNLILDDGELFELSDFNIVALNTIHDDFKSHAVLADGSTMLMEDLWFDPFQSSAEDERKVNLRAKITKNKKRWFNN